MQDLLETIVAATRQIIQTRRESESIEDLELRAEQYSPRREYFEAELKRSDRLNVIAECKWRSPSKGRLVVTYDPTTTASLYAKGGAAAISVLTEPTFFDGSLEHLKLVSSVVDRPLLRKDFIVDEYQLFEARASSADAVLLIVAALDQAALLRLHAQALKSGLAVLVEVHNTEEARRAVDIGARIIGVNNRNLHSLSVDLEVSHNIIKLLPQEVISISESGLHSHADLLSLSSEGYDGFLIGERLMVDSNPAETLAKFVYGEQRLASEPK